MMKMNAGHQAMMAALLVAYGTAAAAQGSTPTPRPFPGSGNPGSTTPARPTTPPVSGGPSGPSGPAQPPPAPNPSPSSAAPSIGSVAMYPNAEFLDSYDAGQGQRYFLYGVEASFESVVSFYRQALRTGSKEIYKVPAVYLFELGQFRDDRMAYPPSVVIKDYSGATPAGYLFAKGAVERRYPTIIQIVPPTAATGTASR